MRPKTQIMPLDCESAQLHGRVVNITNIESIENAKSGPLELLIVGSHIDLSSIWSKLCEYMERCESIGRICLLKAWHVKPEQLQTLRANCFEMFVDDIWHDETLQESTDGLRYLLQESAAATAFKLGCVLFPELGLNLNSVDEEQLLRKAQEFWEFLTRGCESLVETG